MWTDSLNTLAYLSVTLHYIENYQFESLIIGARHVDRQHTTETLKDSLREVLKEWDIDISQIVLCTTDGASNIVSAAKGLFNNKHLHCFAHLLNLIIKDATDKDKEFRQILDEIKSLVTYFKRSTLAAEQLRKEQLNQGKAVLKLIQECPTTWNTIFTMIERFLHLYKYIVRSLLELRNVDLHVPDSATCNSLQECKELFQPFYVATQEMSSQKVITISKIIPMIICLEAAVTDVMATTILSIQIKEVLTSSMKKRFQPLKDNVFLCKATILDPRFKTKPIKTAIMKARALEEINSEIVRAMEKRSNSGQDEIPHNSLWSYYDQMPEERYGNTSGSSYLTPLRHYIETPAIP